MVYRLINNGICLYRRNHGPC